jgi:hypothetical protein
MKKVLFALLGAAVLGWLGVAAISAREHELHHPK